ncbi:modifier of mdg4-like isoform X1 [Uranotaenia lowii]|uniref:modifier of mdg4-like isoform X1 n=1 Tax=Uranotaenia lowii TaxID=190385 RepID=UPI0024798C8F|nr:modifier of mdg4-like isoform X1 [Uranotaenia lowii]
MADDEQFSLCWNNFNTNLSAGFHESLIRGDLVDVTLAAEGQLVKAHRLILSVCSPYFRKMFTQMPANQHAFIFLKDVSHSALKDLIQFMYCGEVNVKQDALPAFISTAEALQIKGLTESGESAPPHQSPAKETSHHIVSSMVSIPSNASSPRAKPIQRTRIQSYKPDSEDGSDHEKIVQIQAQSTPIVAASSSSSGQSATIVTTQVTAAPQQIQILQQTAQKRTITQRASITPQTTQIMKRAKLSDPLEATEPTQIQTVQIVKQITPTPQPSISSEPEYVEMPIETINPKAEPEYADDPSEVEAIDTEHEQEQALAEHETDHDQGADDSANYVEDETYGDMSKYDETYFTEGDDAKAGASGFGTESYTEGTSTDQAAQGTTPTDRKQRVFIVQVAPESYLKHEIIGTGISGLGMHQKSSPVVNDDVREEEDPDISSLVIHRPSRKATKAIKADRVRESDEGSDIHDRSVKGFTFPLQTPADVELLEMAIRGQPTIKRQYIDLLRKTHMNHPKPQVAFLKLFTDNALASFNYSGRCNFSGEKKFAMKDYWVFTECVYEAWSDFEKPTDVQRHLSSAITLVNTRIRGARFRHRKKKTNE